VILDGGIELPPRNAIKLWQQGYHSDRLLIGEVLDYVFFQARLWLTVQGVQSFSLCRLQCDEASYEFLPWYSEKRILYALLAKANFGSETCNARVRKITLPRPRKFILTQQIWNRYWFSYMLCSRRFSIWLKTHFNEIFDLVWKIEVYRSYLINLIPLENQRIMDTNPILFWAFGL